MKRLPYRDHHLRQFLAGYAQLKEPLDLAIHRYFRAHPALGSHDRAVISETLYALVRWQGLIDYLCEGSHSWEERLSVLKQLNPSDYRLREDIPLHIRASFPKALFSKLERQYGRERAFTLAHVLNQPAPTTVRANALKISRDALLARLEGRYPVIPCQKGLLGITFLKRVNFSALPEFKEGFFEVQDEASQLVAELVRAKPGERVLDWCAGSGGKALAIASRMGGKGQIWLHDVRIPILFAAKRRLKRAGVQNGQLVAPDDHRRLKSLKKKMDWVLVDAPCTGTGTLRRNPEMKWRYSDQLLDLMVGKQRNIFERALSFLRPGGKIVYVTCSLLKEENEDQLHHFLSAYPLRLVEPPFQSLPLKGGMDGFFGAVLERCL